IRLSPGAYVHLAGSPEDRAVFDYLLAELNERPLAYIHLGIFDDNLTFDYLGGRASAYLRAHYKGHLVGGGCDAAARAAAA
ncbi:hypothetical protein O4G76_21490, partial [Limimaricola sp. G21655-S1]|nr:hypothetical protein [Limimaricola sp. G21655-S1]